MLSRSAPRDDAAYASFVTAASPRLLHSAELLTGSKHDAEDAVQAVLIRMYLKWSRIEQDDPIGYARRALANEVTDRWRRRKGREALRHRPPDRAESDPALEQGRHRDEALRLLAGLTDKERAVVVLRYFEDLSESQTAATLGIAVGTVKSTANRALARLRVADNASGAQSRRG
jgi:RNA polymerase sigma-70 factor (sigma-E family)